MALRRGAIGRRPRRPRRALSTGAQHQGKTGQEAADARSLPLERFGIWCSGIRKNSGHRMPEFLRFRLRLAENTASPPESGWKGWPWFVAELRLMWATSGYDSTIDRFAESRTQKSRKSRLRVNPSGFSTSVNFKDCISGAFFGQLRYLRKRRSSAIASFSLCHCDSVVLCEVSLKLPTVV